MWYSVRVFIFSITQKVHTIIKYILKITKLSIFVAKLESTYTFNIGFYNKILNHQVHKIFINWYRLSILKWQYKIFDVTQN